MRTLTQWLAEYSESHQNPTNQLIHKICVPAIVLSIVCMLSAAGAWWLGIAFALALVFYARLSIPYTVISALVFVLMLWFASILSHPFVVGLTIFVIAWIGQFYGHHLEGKKPSFFKDVQFLLIGPLWTLSHFVPHK